MCRHFCYLGEPVTLAEAVSEPPHSLVVQSYAPCDMRGGGKVNADGFGVGWYVPTEGGVAAARYRRSGPIWQDAGFTALAAATRSSAILGAVRNATVGMPVIETANAPFTDGHWLFSLNGRIDGWPGAAVALADTLGTAQLLTLDAPTDSALLWAALQGRLAVPGADPARVLSGLVAEVLAAAPGSRLNLLLTNGSRCWATTVTHALWYRRRADGVVLASERFDDDPGWQAVEDGRLVTADRTGIDIRSLAELQMET